MNSLKLTAGVLALSFWSSSFFIWKYFDAHGLRAPDSQNGNIYPLNTHGSIVYITYLQHHLLYGLILVGAAFFLLTIVFYFSGGKQL